MDPVAAASQWDDYLARPGNRQALLQIGLQMMQPVAIGQSTMGHIGQAIGAGGEAVGRLENSDLKLAVADSRMDMANEKLRIAQQNADSRQMRDAAAASKSAGKKVGGLTDLMRLRMEREDARNAEKAVNDEAELLFKEANDLINPPTERAAAYKGKSQLDIRDDLRKKRGAPSSSSTEEPVAALSDDPAEMPPPVPGARKAPDGNWYAPDPKRPGKYLVVK